MKERSTKTLPRSTLIAAISVAAIVVFTGRNGGFAQQSGKQTGARAGNSHESQIARGQYIVEGVAVCGQCHTPRDDQGNPENGKKLQGAAVWLEPAERSSDWPLRAPRLAGTPPASDEDLIKLLTTGVWTDGRHLRPPMPQFRMDRPDAEAVVAYLRSLNPTPQ